MNWYYCRRFKALQNLVIMYYSEKIYDKMIDRYRGMLIYISSVTRNECTDAINAILDSLTTSVDSKVLSEMYEITLLALKTSNNERLWFNTNLKLAKLYLEDRKFNEVERLILSLKKTCQTADGKDDVSKGTYLLEVYCLEIQLCAVTHNSARMKEIYPKTVNLNAAVADPRIMGVIREEGGKMQMAEGNWEEAYNELYEAFRNYQEAGNSRARDCLKVGHFLHSFQGIFLDNGCAHPFVSFSTLFWRLCCRSAESIHSLPEKLKCSRMTRRLWP